MHIRSISEEQVEGVGAVQVADHTDAATAPDSTVWVDVLMHFQFQAEYRYATPRSIAEGLRQSVGAIHHRYGSETRVRTEAEITNF